jgi:protein TonB
VAPALLTAPDLSAMRLPDWGDPLANSRVPSNGSGARGGMGTGKEGGVGSGNGPGSGPGSSPGAAGYRSLQSGITAPRVIYQIDPEFSEEARRAKLYGTVILVIDVDTSGRVVNVRIAKSLGLGLDEKAVEAVSRRRFRPGQRDGKPIIVPATIEVNFHLL